MARTINRVELLGRVGADPEMRYTNNGHAVVSLRLATDRPRSDGESDTDWHTVVCWRKLAELVDEYVGRGGRLYVSGRLVQRSYETESGERRYSAEVHASDVVFLDYRSDDDGAAGAATGTGEASPF